MDIPELPNEVIDPGSVDENYNTNVFQPLIGDEDSSPIPLEQVPTREFATLAEGEKFLIEFAAARGFAVRKDGYNTRKSDKSIVRQNYVCTLGKNRSWSPASGDRKRSRMSKSENCPCKYCLTLYQSTGLWKLRQYQGERHSHEQMSAIEIPLTRRRKRNETVAMAAIEFTAAMATPRVVLDQLSQMFPDVPITLSDVQNERSKLKRKRLEGRADP